VWVSPAHSTVERGPRVGLEKSGVILQGKLTEALTTTRGSVPRRQITSRASETKRAHWNYWKNEDWNRQDGIHLAGRGFSYGEEFRSTP